jgi:hypothetical protein
MAVDGLQARLDTFQGQINAIRQTVEHLSRGRRPEAAPQKRKSVKWTPAMRRAAAARMKQRWKEGKIGPKARAKRKAAAR